MTEYADFTPPELIGDGFNITDAMQFLNDINVVTDWCGDYGEPGYKLDNPAGFLALGNWWCRDKNCDYTDTYENGDKKMHFVDFHYSKLFERLAEEGMEIDWDDEWVIDHNGDKAYRTQGDSYSWQSSIRFSSDGEMLTPDDDIEDWIEDTVNSPRKCLPTHIWSNEQLAEVGFTEYECGFESGWYEGQTDDPVKITEGLRERFGDTIDILFKLSGVGQFDIAWCVLTRPVNDED